MASILRARTPGADYRAEVRWEEEWVHDPYARRVHLYVLAGSGVEGRPYLPEAPSVPRASDGVPSCRLTLRLRRRPTVDETALGPLIDQASFTAVLTTDIELDAPYRPHFVRAARCTLEGSGIEAASSQGSGAGTRMALTLPAIPPDVAFEIWNALHGVASALSVRTTFDLRGTGAPTGGASFERPLDAVLGGIADGVALARIVDVIAPSDAGGYERVPSLVTARRSRDRGRAALPVMVAAHTVVPVAAAVTPHPAAPANAHVLMASDAAQPVAAAHHVNIALLDHIVLTSVSTAPVVEHLPVVDDVTSAIFKDRADPNTYWYPPVFTLKVPAASDDPNSSAFAFTFRRTGVEPGPPPRPTLEATVRFVLDAGMSPEAQSALAQLNHPAAAPLPLDGLSVTLDVPYMEHGTLQAQSFAAQIEQSGTTITATVPLLDDAVRMAYGSLAYPADFQAQPAALSVAYTYRAYTPVPAGGLHLVAGGKIALLPIALGRQLARALPASAMGAVMIRPSLMLSAEAVHVAAEPQYAIRPVGRDQRVDAKFACGDFGAFYADATSQPASRVGCTDALKLGEIALKLYDEIVELRSTPFRVYRSLTQPGMFLVCPSTYRIARFGHADGDKAFRPAVMVYSVLDPDPSKNAFFLQATLQPDIPVDARIGLETALAAKSPHGQAPVIRYPTELSFSTPPVYHWMLPDGIGMPSVQLLPDSFAVGVSTDLTNALLLINVIQQSGLNGSVTFEFEDGTSLQSALTLDTSFTGPWDTGPVEASIGAAAVTLTNRIERPVNVFDLFVASGGAVPQQRPVNATLAPDETRDVPLTAVADAAYCTYAVAPGPAKLDELDIFIEDVTTNVIFVNQVSLPAHNLKGLSAEARLKGTAHVYELPDVSGASTSLTLTLPLTSYLDAQTLEYRITKIATDGTASPTSWLEADLRQSGVVSITWDLIGS